MSGWVRPSSAAARLWENPEPGLPAALLQNFQHVLTGNGDAAGCWGGGTSGEMEKDGAAQALNAGPPIVGEHYNNVVKIIGSRQELMAGGVRQADKAIIAAVSGRVAPAVSCANGADGQRRARRQRPVSTIKDLDQSPVAGWRCSIAFAFAVADAGTAQETGEFEGTQ
jgi:hypothetical protein